MTDDHTKAGEQLKEGARSLDITLPSELNSVDQAQYDELSKLSGPEFDQAYMQTMVKDHEKDVAEFKQEATSGKNPAIKNFAAQRSCLLWKTTAEKPAMWRPTVKPLCKGRKISIP